MARRKGLIGALGLSGLALIAGIAYAWHHVASLERVDAQVAVTASSSVRAVPVVITSAAVREFEERINVQGTVEAKTYANVASPIGGTLTHLYVDEGDAVEAGKTVLFAVDDVKAARAADMSRQALAMAQAARRERAANMEQVEAELEKSSADLARFEDLHGQNAVSLDALEQQQSRHKQAVAMRKHAQSLIDMADEQVRQAQAAVAIAQKDLTDATVVAPISGYVTVRMLKEGENAEPGKPVVRIEDPAVVEVSAHLPAQYYPRVVLSKTPMRVHVYGLDAGEQPITYKTPVINPTLRTFEVKCVLDPAPADVVPGAMAEVNVVLNAHAGPGVPSSAVLVRDNRSVIFTVEHEAARMVSIEKGLESDGWIEVLGGAMNAGTPVVTEGHFMLDDGTPVAIRTEQS
jgi:HlyD family secretion protein